jgi:hypothetical protein
MVCISCTLQAGTFIKFIFSRALMEFYVCVSNTRTEIRVLRGKFGPKREEVGGEWRKLYNEELIFIKYYYNSQINEDNMGGACSMHENRKFWSKNLKE